MFKIKDGYKLELQMSETMNVFGSTKKLIDKTKTVENVSYLEVVEEVLVQCTLVDNQYQRKSEVLYTSTPNKSYAYLLTYHTEFDKIIIKFAYQNGTPSEIEDKVNLTLLTNRWKYTFFCKTKNNKICQRMWIFVIREKYI